jgi:hypothetical protein
MASFQLHRRRFVFHKRNFTVIDVAKSKTGASQNLKPQASAEYSLPAACSSGTAAQIVEEAKGEGSGIDLTDVRLWIDDFLQSITPAVIFLTWHLCRNSLFRTKLIRSQILSGLMICTISALWAGTISSDVRVRRRFSAKHIL